MPENKFAPEGAAKFVSPKGQVGAALLAHPGPVEMDKRVGETTRMREQAQVARGETVRPVKPISIRPRIGSGSKYPLV